MDTETPIVRYIAGALGVVIVCFCVGFFAFAPPRNAPPAASATPAPEPSTLVVRGGPAPKLTVLETTSTPVPERLRPRREEKETPTARTTEATPALKQSPDPEATPASTTRRPRKADDEAIQLPAPKAGEEKPTPDDEEIKPASTPSEENKKPEGGGPDTVYRVRVKDAFNSHDDADQLASELKGRGFAASVMPAGKGKFEVQIGAYKDKKRAEEKQKELEKNSYKTRVTDKEIDLDKTDKPDPPKSKEKDKEPEKEAKKADESKEKSKEGDN